MKKIITAILALSMICAAATGCSDSSSSKDTSAAGVSSSSAVSSDTSSQAEKSAVTEKNPALPDSSSEKENSQSQSGAKFEDTFTYKLMQTTKSKTYSMSMVMDYMSVKIPLQMDINGENFHMTMDMSAMGGDKDTETFYVDGKTYALIRAQKVYSITEGNGSAASKMTVDLTPEGNVELISVSEENGMTVEKVKVKSQNEQGIEMTTQADYYYDKSTGTPKKIIATAAGVKSTIEITSFSDDAPEIKLPDFTGWTKVDANYQDPNAKGADPTQTPQA